MAVERELLCLFMDDLSCESLSTEYEYGCNESPLPAINGCKWGYHSINEGYRRKFRSQTSDNMDRWKAETGRAREKRRVEERRSEKRKSQKKEDPGARKGRKVAKHCVFPMICGSGGLKSRLAKAAGAEPSGQMRDEKCAPSWPKAHLQVKKLKTPHVRTTFGSWDV